MLVRVVIILKERRHDDLDGILKIILLLISFRRFLELIFNYGSSDILPIKDVDDLEGFDLPFKSRFLTEFFP